MAGKLIVDTIDTDNAFITLNVQQSTIATMNVSGIYSNTGVKMIGANGSVSNTAITGVITASQLATSLNLATNNVQVTSIQTATGTPGITFAANGQITLANTPLQLTGGQIVFPATQSASSDANTLDDYEEGTWTPTLFGSGGSAGAQAYSNQYGNYVKVGKMVTLTGYLLLTNKGSWTGQVSIGGFPFTVANAQAAYSAVSFYNSNLSWPAGGSGGGAYPVINTTQANMFYYSQTGSPAADYSQINNNSQIGAWTFVYFTN